MDPHPHSKGRGVALAPKQTMVDIHEHALGGAAYEEISPLSIIWDSIYQIYQQVVAAIRESDVDTQFSSVLQSFEGGIPRAIPDVGETIKTHKEAGDVTFRILHKKRHHTFSGLGN